MRWTVPVFVLTLALCGCGIKPSKLDPPPGAKHDAYPKTYPNPATDPPPERANNP